MGNRIVLIDGNSVFYREYYAMPLSMKSGGGQPTNAIFGFAGLLIKVIETLKPTHIAVAFDYGKRTFRHDIYKDYKAGRKPMPEDLKMQIAPLRKMLELMNICYIEKDGIEGDDILGTLAKRFDDETLIVTGDRDVYQLVDKNTKIYLTKKGLTDVKILDEKAIYDEFSLTPSQMIQLKALMGDKSDNIPGASGVGEKTAINLMKEYGSIENIYVHANEIKGKVGENIRNSKENVEISLKLAKINTDVNISCTLDDMKYDFPFSEEVRSFFIDMEFRSFLKREELFSGSVEYIEPVNKNFNILNIQSVNDIDEIIKKSKETGEFLISDFLNEIYVSEGKNEYKICNIELKTLILNLKTILEDENILKIVFDSKKVMHILDKFDVKLINYFDVSIARYLESGNTVPVKEDMFLQLGFDRETPCKSLVASRILLEEALEKYNMHDLYYKIELPLSKVLFDMEKFGFKVDTKQMDKLQAEYTVELNELTQRIYKMLGREFNIKSPKQLAEVIYDELKLKRSKKRSTDIDTLLEIEGRHPLIPLIIRYRKVQKFLSTYIDGLIPHLDKNNFIHTNFKQTLTTTGRLSSTDPNLQNIPARNEESRVIRSMFVASSEDRVLVDADYSQIELRLLAHMSEDEKLINAFNNNEDIHMQTACFIYNVTPDLVTPEMRRNAKVVNFGVIYGISDYGLATDLNTSVADAREYINSFFKNHPNIEKFMQTQINNARETGRATSMFGRTRKMLDINSSNYNLRMRAERASQNMPVQGTAADVIKLAMLNVDKALKEKFKDAHLIMQIHDELIIDTPKEIAEDVLKLVQTEMENVCNLSVPLLSDGKISYRWSEGH